jgi:hypothetical protein
MSPQSMSKESRTRLHAAWSDEVGAAREARRTGDPKGEWAHLERAHILSQPLAATHVRTHLAMFGAAFRHHDVHEALGQVFRMLVAAPGSVTGKYPVGNTGGADVSAFEPMPIPDDLVALLGGSPAEVS